MIIIKSINRLKKEVDFKANVGFVPTMGSLHRGHLSLIESSKKKANKTIVSIFVNPSQFNSKKDFKKYPRNLSKDINILKKLKVDYLFLPTKNEIFRNKKDLKIKLQKNQKILCAKFRKGHFEGVLGVINQLLKVVKAKYIFLGEKDYQQVYLIKNFIRNKFKTKVISCSTIRNINYFAYSSRNLLLKKNDIKNATLIINYIKNFRNSIIKKKINFKELINVKKKILNYCQKIDYIEIRNKKDLSESFNRKNFKIFIAFYINNIRLIDNF